MASNSNLFKTYTRNRRELTIETDFDMGMMFTNGVVEFHYVKLLVNYNLLNNGTSLIPRAGLRLDEIILPDLFDDVIEVGKEYHENDAIKIVAAKDCIEDGKTYRQFILGKSSHDNVDSKLWICTSPESDQEITSIDSSYLITKAIGKNYISGDNCTFNVSTSSKIHHMNVEPEVEFSSIIGTFAFGNNYYYLNPIEGKLCKTVFDEALDKYVVNEDSYIVPKELDPSEAVTFGYNMLQGDNAYVFVNTALEGNIQFTGILPYSVKDPTKLLMTPKKNEEIYFRCYFKADVGNKYKFVFEWRSVDKDTWETIQSKSKSPTYEVIDDGDGKVKLSVGGVEQEYLQVSFKVPADEVMLRVQAFRVEGSAVSEDVEQAMNVGFDFSAESYGLSTNVEQETYDLITATGMTSWKNRLVLFGVSKDPTILFVSDVNEPSYFPYPNNISIFDEPIVDVKSYMDTLLVFTTNSVYQVTLNDDGTSWKTTLVQSNLKLELFDRHLIQVVRNMVFFKSGNYYYMIVPKAQSTTGELTLAPVSTPIVEFFNNFENNVTALLNDVFDYKESFSLVNFYNFLDYEDVHNMYVFKYEDDENNGYLHLDILYNTVSRVWKIYTFESAGYLYPYRQDATQTGVLASTALFNIDLGDEESSYQLEQKTCSRLNDKFSVLQVNKNVEILNTIYTHVSVKLNNVLTEYRFYPLEFDSVNNRLYGLDTTGNVRLEYDIAGDQGNIRLISSVGDIFDASNTIMVSNYGYFDDDPEAGYLFDSSEYDINYASYGGVYLFSNGFIKEDSKIYFNDIEYTLEKIRNGLFVAKLNDDVVYITEVEDGYAFVYKEMFLDPSSLPEVKVISNYETVDLDTVSGRVLQLLKFDDLKVQDFYLANNYHLLYSDTNGFTGYSDLKLSEVLSEALEEIDDLFVFKNWQYIDTGYRDDALERKKRYRELQLQLNNIEGADLNFGFSFILDGQERYSYYAYETEHIIDENDPNYGLIYILGSPYMNLNMNRLETPNETILGEDINAWSLNQSMFPEVSLWKIRAHVSGKGAAPRMKLLSRNTNRFELMNINWVCRYMNTR